MRKIQRRKETDNEKRGKGDREKERQRENCVKGNVYSAGASDNHHGEKEREKID